MKEEKRVNLFKQNKSKYPISLTYWEDMVREIIDNKCKDPSKIELNFDELIPHLSNDSISHLYIQLLEYYKKIDSEGATYYWELFDNDFKNDANIIGESSTIAGDFDGEDFFYD